MPSGRWAAVRRSYDESLDDSWTDYAASPLSGSGPPYRPKPMAKSSPAGKQSVSSTSGQDYTSSMSDGPSASPRPEEAQKSASQDVVYDDGYVSPPKSARSRIESFTQHAKQSAKKSLPLPKPRRRK